MPLASFYANLGHNRDVLYNVVVETLAFARANECTDCMNLFQKLLVNCKILTLF